MNRTARTDEERRALFLAALAETANVTRSARAARLPRTTLYEWKNALPEFSAAWDQAVEMGTDSLEDEAMRRAKDGVLKPVFQGGRAVGVVREFSDVLTIFLLKGRRPEKYRERFDLEHSGKGGVPLPDAGGEVARRVAELLALGLERQAAGELPPASGDGAPPVPAGPEEEAT